MIKFLFALLLAYSVVNAKDDICTQLEIYKKDIEANYYSWDRAALESLNKRIMNDKDYSKSWHFAYYSSILDIQLGKIYYLIDKDKAYNYFAESIDKLEAIQNDGDLAEIYTLLSVAYGKKSSLSTLMAIVYGMKAKDLIYSANDISRNNPKILLTAAVHLMHTPVSFGGSKEKSRKLLNKALEVIKAGWKEDKLLVKWADTPEILAYLANLEILLEKKSAAENYMKKALNLIPNYGFVKYDLYPQFKKLDD